MDSTSSKPSFLRNIFVRLLLFGLFIIAVRFTYVVTVTGESCTVGDFCFFSLPESFNFVITTSTSPEASSAISVKPSNGGVSDLYTSKDWIKAVHFYSSIFQDLIAHGYLSPDSKSLTVETRTGQEVYALRQIGVEDSIGIFKKASGPLVIKAPQNRIPFDNNTFDFVFIGEGKLDNASRPLDLSSEIVRTVKPGGYVVAHIVPTKDTYSFNSFLELFNSCKLIKSHQIEGLDSKSLMPFIHEVVLRKEVENVVKFKKTRGNSVNKCFVPGHKLELVKKAEPLISTEPMKPWITLKRNIQNIKYLTSMADIRFKNRYVYVDVGARSYGSSIGSWFKKQYPKQNKTFDVYAIEADKAFHEEYRLKKKKVTLLPYAAWVRNESLMFEINRDPGKEVEEDDKAKRGMGRIQPAKNSGGGGGGSKREVNEIQGFDFAEWLKSTVTERDFVVMKMDVEGTEFDLIPRLFETGAICLIDEIFLECHYNRWQRCCPGERSAKYEKSYGQCLDLFRSLRESGVLVHQWW